MSTTQEAQKQEEVKNTESSSLLDDIIKVSKVKPSDEYYDITKKGIQSFIDLMLQSEDEKSPTPEAVDRMIAEIDRKVSKQMDAILHNEDFQRLESSWKGFKFLIDRTNFRENIKITMINVSKEELLSDFQDSAEVTQSGLYKHVYTSEYGQFGGEPYGGIIANYVFGSTNQDIELLRNVASVSAMSHAPFIAAAGHEFFGIESFEELAGIHDLKAVFEAPSYAKWRGFRKSEDARYVGLTLPRFLLRLPYGTNGIPVEQFNYNEDVTSGDDSFLWGNTSFAFASCMVDSFAKYRWCANVIGPKGGGAVLDLPIYNFEAMGEVQTKIPTQILISERKDFELSEEGFIALSMRKGSDNAAFFAANSCQEPKKFANTPDGNTASLNYKLGMQLPYLYIVSRLAHYIKVIQRENIGLWKERADLENELNEWIRQYVSDQENPGSQVRSRRPLRRASIEIMEVEGEPGWYNVSMKFMPHFKYMGANFTLSLVGKLDT